MTKGVLLFAHNSRQLDYLKLSIIAGKLAKKNLSVPVSLVTDNSTLDWAKESDLYDQITQTFEHVISKEYIVNNNYRVLNDGDSKETVPFRNSTRTDAWEVTPYDRTLVIDSDFFIFSNNFSDYWDIDQDFLISAGVRDINDQDRMQYFDRYISDTGVRLLWATTMMFTKNEHTEMFFNLVKHIQDNYIMYSEIYRYDYRVYRNDISFSLAYHIFSGFTNFNEYFLPPVLSAIDKDILIDIDTKGRLKFLINDFLKNSYVATSMIGADVHIMNKQAIIRNFDKFVEAL